MNLLDANFLFASLFWGSVGVGCWIYGKKQRELMPMLGGVAMIGVSCLVSSWLLMTLLCIALMGAVYLLVKRGG
ncbi:MAG: hypothetical protein MUF81_01040 [Verrucomicrobia bacterium]|jgi:hypothetical protein|nr:hypothetical protein [Verrucomicrobiota bacterium]